MPKFLRRRDGIAVRNVEHEVLLLDAAANRIHQLNRTARLVWDECVVPRSVDEISAAMMELFDVSPELAVRDIVGTLEQLRSLKLVQEVEEAPECR